MGFDDVHKALNLIPVPYPKHLHKIRQLKRETDDDCCNLYLLPSFLLWILFNASYQKKSHFSPGKASENWIKHLLASQHPSSRFSPTSLAHSVPSAWKVQLSLIHLVNSFLSSMNTCRTPSMKSLCQWPSLSHPSLMFPEYPVHFCPFTPFCDVWFWVYLLYLTVRFSRAGTTTYSYLLQHLAYSRGARPTCTRVLYLDS